MKALIVILSYGEANDCYLKHLIDEYRSMSLETDIKVLSNVPKNVDGAEVIVISRNKKFWYARYAHAVRRGLRTMRQEYRNWVRQMDLPRAHKQMFADQVDNYDLFVYSEDDTLLTERNLRSFLSAVEILPPNVIPGFLRVEHGRNGARHYCDVHGRFHWDPARVKTYGGRTFAFHTNEHSACYVVTRGQLRRAIDSGGFLGAATCEKYDLLCQAATDIYTQCGFEKLICISELGEFLLRHLPNKYVGNEWGVEETEFHRQVEVLLRIAGGSKRGIRLFESETKLPDRAYSKSYYEAVREDVISVIPSAAQTVLSIGTGSGAMERRMATGRTVTTLPLDSVIAGALEGDGIEVVNGDFVEARARLSGRVFDCLFFSNVLHLVHNPVELLSSFSELVSGRGSIVAVIPNTTRLGAGRSPFGSGQLDGDQVFATTGVQRTSAATVRDWFTSAGLCLGSIRSVLRPRSRTVGRITHGLIDPRLADEFIVAAYKASS